MNNEAIAKILPLVAPSGGAGPHPARVGRLVPGAPLRVDFPGNPRGPVPSRVLEGLDPAALATAAKARREVLLVFDGGCSDRPVIVGLLATSNLESTDLELAEAPDVVELDGRRVELRGRDEIVLRCGAASITLRRNGRVVLRGTLVESCSEGVNRIRGGSVQIN